MRHKILIAMMVMSVFLLMGCGRANNAEDPNNQTEDQIDENGDNTLNDGTINDSTMNDDTVGEDAGDGVIGDIGDGIGDVMDGVGNGVGDAMDGVGNAVEDVTDGTGNAARDITEQYQRGSPLKAWPNMAVPFKIVEISEKRIYRIREKEYNESRY